MYLSDVVSVPPKAMEQIRGAKILIVDALNRMRLPFLLFFLPPRRLLRVTFAADLPHPSHFCISEAIELVREIMPEKAYLTGLSHAMLHDDINTLLASHTDISAEAAYDGLVLQFTHSKAH